VAAGGVGFEEAVRLVAERGEAMQEAADDNPGIMLAVTGIDDERARIACRRADGDVWLANSNAPGECVIAGRPPDVQRAAEVAAELGAVRTTPVKVGGAFHTPLMVPAQPRLRKALEITTFYPLAVPVVANVDSLPTTPGGMAVAALRPVAQPRALAPKRPVLAAIMRTGEWDGDALFCELGPGGPLSAMVRATAPEATTVAIAVPDDLDTLVATLTGETAVLGAAEGHQGERLYVSERLIISPCAGIFDLPAGTTGPAGPTVEIGDLLGLVSAPRSAVPSPASSWASSPTRAKESNRANP